MYMAAAIWSYVHERGVVLRINSLLPTLAVIT